MIPLSLQSEPYSASGNLAADGFKKLLGTPTLDLLSTVIREALQNSCDAAKKGKGPTVIIRLRELSEKERDTLENVVLSHSIPDSKSSSRFKELAQRSTRWMLEISDIGTVGLTGPTRADRIPPGCRDTDFATETAELTRNQIIQQASVSVLSQANQRPQKALSLLG